MQRLRLIALAALALAAPALADNRPDRLEWLRDQGFGLFIHWSLDSQLGSVISHSMVGASDDYLKRYLELPKTFNPHKFNARDWAVLAKLAGIKYVVFTAKHHSGFCMFDTATTPFNIMHTPFPRNITGEILKAFKEQGIAPGLYFSPDDFHWLYGNGKLIDRNRPEVAPANNPGLLKLDQAQVRELLTKYGPVDVVFFDGPAEGLRDLAWELQPNIVVTRGAIQTPEQYIPGVPLEGAWESCITMGTQWQYKPTNEQYKSGRQLIGMLIETRAKGGNLLLNIGPKPDGELAVEQEERLREIALWMFVNGESIYGVRPWVITNEGDLWFTKKKDEDTVYIHVNAKERWPHGEWKDFTLHSVRATDRTEITVLGQNDRVLEYNSGVIPKTTWKQQPDGLHIRAARAQRLYNDRKWPNPVVLKATHVQPALKPPRIETVRAAWDRATRTVTFEGAVQALGDAPAVEVGFEIRSVRGADVNERSEPWKPLGLERRTSAGGFTKSLAGLPPGQTYDYRAVVKHPLLTMYGAEKKITLR